MAAAAVSEADQQREQQEQWLAEVSRVEIEQGDLDNAREGVDGPIRMADLLESGQRTMPSAAGPNETTTTTTADSKTDSSSDHQQQNLQVVNSLPLKP